jgi:hypothetical protein
VQGAEKIGLYSKINDILHWAAVLSLIKECN